MTAGNLLRLDNVGIMVRDMERVIAFFTELGLSVDGRTTVEGEWVDRTIGIENARCEIAMLSTPDGGVRLELSRFITPKALGDGTPVPVNTLGIRRLMFAVDDLHAVLVQLQAVGAELIGEVTQYRDMYLLCYVNGPEGIMIALAEKLY
ncbi:VOC family protein [bacterium]|nr:VOC family protein [bacterium]